MTGRLADALAVVMLGLGLGMLAGQLAGLVVLRRLGDERARGRRASVQLAAGLVVLLVGVVVLFGLVVG